ncbi:MAG TPA: hypothetical protein VI669_11840 [Vicinamibacteria bacterium]
MATDIKLKVLFRTYAKDLMRLTGDEGARVLAVDTVELQELRRQADCVIKLRRGGETYYRHLEFQGQADPQMAARCFRYNSQLVLQLGAAVLTTVVYLTARAPREGELAFRVMLGGREINVWRFEVLRLWEVEAKKAVLGGAPGVLALVPLMAGGQDFETIRRAWRAVRAAVPGERVSPAESILLALASERYTVAEIEKLVGRPRMMQSSIWREALAEGRVEGRVATERELCLELVRRNHPGLARRAASQVNACEDPAILRRWALAASDPSSDLVRLMGLAKLTPRSSARRPSAVRRKRR